MRNQYIIAYDISDSKRLNRLHNCLLGYGDSIQYSIFVCGLSLKEKEIMVADIYSIIRPSEDSVIIYNAGRDIDRKLETIGIKKKIHERKAIII